MEGLAWSGADRDVFGRDRWSGRVLGINRGAAPTSGKLVLGRRGMAHSRTCTKAVYSGGEGRWAGRVTQDEAGQVAICSGQLLHGGFLQVSVIKCRCHHGVSGR